MAQLEISVIEDSLYKFFYKFPNLPRYIRDFFVVYLPYLIIIFGIMEVFTSGLWEIFNNGPEQFFSSNKALNPNYYLNILFSFIIGIICVLTFKPLLNRNIKGWRMLFYANILLMIVTLAKADAVTLILYIIGFYFLFQIKEYYR